MAKKKPMPKSDKPNPFAKKADKPDMKKGKPGKGMKGKGAC